MSYLVLGILIIVVAAIFNLVAAVRHTPEGHEDETGFHYGQVESSSEFAVGMPEADSREPVRMREHHWSI